MRCRRPFVVAFTVWLTSFFERPACDVVEMAEVLVIMTGISATIKLENEKAVTVTKRVEERDTNLKLVVDVNEISRQYCGDARTWAGAYRP